MFIKSKSDPSILVNTIALSTILLICCVAYTSEYNDPSAVDLLIQGIELGDMDNLKNLLEFVSGVDFDAETTSGWTLLTASIKKGSMSEENRLAFIRLLFYCRPNLNIDQEAGSLMLSPLMYAIKSDYNNIVYFLITQGANVNIPRNAPPIEAAAYHNHINMVRLLLQARANPNAVNVDSRRTALSHAAEHGNYYMMKALLNAGANPNIPDRQGLTPFMYTLLKANTNVAAIASILLANHATFPDRDWVKNNWNKLPQRSREYILRYIEATYCNKP